MVNIPAPWSILGHVDRGEVTYKGTTSSTISFVAPPAKNAGLGRVSSWFQSHMLHGAGIFTIISPLFTYMTGCLLGQMLVNIPAPWSIWESVPECSRKFPECSAGSLSKRKSTQPEQALLEVGSHFDVVPAEPEQWSKERIGLNCCQTCCQTDVATIHKKIHKVKRVSTACPICPSTKVFQTSSCYSWCQDPFHLTVEDDNLYGRGTTDCLGKLSQASQAVLSLCSLCW